MVYQKWDVGLSYTVSLNFDCAIINVREVGCGVLYTGRSL
jgi:hypothetical protein